MGLLQKLKSALGLNGTGSSESGRSGDVDVTVEREPSTEDEDAVKGTETASSGTPSTEPDASETTTEESDDESAAPAADEFEPLADDDAADETETDEVDDAATEEAEESSTDTADETDATDNAATGEADDAGADTEGSTDPVTELNGIGPAYGDRLGGAGIETVGELAGADPAELADRIDLGESRVAGWVEQANDY